MDGSGDAVEAVVAGGRPPRGRTDVRDVIKNPRDRLNVKLSRAAASQPKGTKPIATTQPFDRSVLVASADIAGYTTGDRKSTRLNSSHSSISYAVFCLKKKNRPHR